MKRSFRLAGKFGKTSNRAYANVGPDVLFYPLPSTLEAEEYVYTFLRHFPENTFALPQVFRKVVKGLNSRYANSLVGDTAPAVAEL